MSQIVLPRIPEIHDPRMDLVYIDRFLDRPDERPDYLDLIVFIMDRLGIRSGQALDIACGCGEFADQVAQTRENLDVVGIDINPMPIGIANEVYGGRGNLEFRTGDVYDLGDYRDQDLVTCAYSLHHFDDLERALTQVYDVLKPGAPFFFIDFNREYLSEHKATVSMPDGAVVPMWQLIYNARTKGIDDQFLEVFLDEGVFGGSDKAHNQINVLSVLSIIAAYTPDEIRNTLQRTGFRDIDITLDPRNIKYACHAKK
jgi:ubiquinone/menaquinone biosynthesis C-methylase UbiE